MSSFRSGVSDSVQTQSDTIPDPELPRFWSSDAYQRLFRQIHEMTAAHGGARVHLGSRWRSDVRWARNRFTKTGDWRDISVRITHGSTIETNQADLASIRGSVEWAEAATTQFRGRLPGPVAVPAPHEHRTFPETKIWSDATYDQTQDTRLHVAAGLITQAAGAGMLSAGYLSVEARGYVVELPDSRVEYVPVTLIQCSITVRDPKGIASGWAGASSYAWNRIDAEKLAATALDKCVRSQNPVLIEPGRYTLIMEPQATYDLISPLFGGHHGTSYLDLELNRKVESLPFHGTTTTQLAVSQYGPPQMLGSTKLGQRVFDPRITLQWDPGDPDLGIIPFWPNNAKTDLYPLEPVRWVTNGVLTALGYPPGMTINEMRGTIGVIGNINGVRGSGAFRMDGGPTSVEEMIATTERGLLVTRFWDVWCVDKDSALFTGTTRDGVWLVEHGTVSHVVKNLRWTESPMFAFNNVEQIGPAVPIFSPSSDEIDFPGPAVAPCVKVRDFSFTAMEGAV